MKKSKQPTTTPRNGNPTNPLFWRLWQQLRPYWIALAALFLLGLLSAPLALLTPLPLKIVVDSVLGPHPLPQFLGALLPAGIAQSQSALLALAAGLLVVVALVGQVRDFATSWLGAYTGEKLLRGFRAQLFRHVQRLSLAYHDTRGTADSSYRIQYDATALQRIAVDGIVPFFGSACTLVSMLWVTAHYNWKLALVGLAVSPGLFVVSGAYRRRLRRQSREVRHIEGAALSVVHEVLGAARVVKAFGQEEREGQRFAERSDAGLRARLRMVSLEGAFSLWMAGITAAGMAAVLYLGVSDVRSGVLTLGELLLVLGYLGQIYNPLKTLGKKLSSMQSHLASAERAFELLDESPDVAERPHARSLGRARGALAFRDVSFAYDQERPVLRGVSFELEPGRCLGMAGATGAGKTTLVNLLTRFYDPTAGAILLDGVDLRDYKLADLRHQFAIVLQEPVLFSTSLAENIAYARPRAAHSEIVAAAKAADAHEFIMRLPRGYETLAGERGMKLSGGERQRLSLARAFLKDAPILILDEPTSSVDVKTEAAIVEAMARLMRGRTTIIIAHRSSTLTHCDHILKLDDGRVVSLEPSTPVAGPDGPGLRPAESSLTTLTAHV
ncbi:MAG TPA: ABC transporter ATP-binding protein [Verrucomicrobiae bacterium]|nr:ABC transporter ATP-binding protein [Verrucomicrobiae bacterium]